MITNKERLEHIERVGNMVPRFWDIQTEQITEMENTIVAGENIISADDALDLSFTGTVKELIEAIFEDGGRIKTFLVVSEIDEDILDIYLSAKNFTVAEIQWLTLYELEHSVVLHITEN